MIENKQIMARNITKYMELNNKKATDVCKDLGFKQNTFSDWVNAKTYPRIDAIEKLANYFHVSKANLVEEAHFDYNNTTPEIVLLLDAAKGSSAEDLKMATDLLLRLKHGNS